MDAGILVTKKEFRETRKELQAQMDAIMDD